MVKVTKELLEQGRSSRGAWSNRQLRALGLKKGFNFNKGWKYKLIGSWVTEDQVERFLALKDAHLKNKKGYYKPNDDILFEQPPKKKRKKRKDYQQSAQVYRMDAGNIRHLKAI